MTNPFQTVSQNDLATRLRLLQEDRDLGDIDDAEHQRRLVRLRERFGNEAVETALRQGEGAPSSPPATTQIAATSENVAQASGQSQARQATVQGQGQVGVINQGDIGRSLFTGDQATQGRAEVRGSGRVQGVNVGVNDGTIQNFFGTATPAEDQATLLEAYLTSLVHECQQLRLSRLTGRQQTGQEQSTTPLLRLQSVYMSLTTDGTPIFTSRMRDRTAGWLRRLFKRLNLASRTAEMVSPIQVRTPAMVVPLPGFAYRTEKPSPPDGSAFDLLESLDEETSVMVQLQRPELATEAIATQKRLVLLGEPGAGKSTVLRYLALLLAQKALNQVVDLHGWSPARLPVPLLCPLGAVARALTQENVDADKALWQALGDVLDGSQGIRAGLRDHLKPALRTGGVLLLFDGLDELSTSGENPRKQVAHALRRFAAEVPQTTIVVTCRVLPYQVEGDWKLPTDEGWTVRTIQPLAFGQVQQFVRQWYTELADKDTALDRGEAQERSDTLIAALRDHPRLQPLIRSPLLLTMLAILHGNRNEIPDDRVTLYEECVELLLERWEPARTPGIPHQGLIERLAIPNLQLTQIREELHTLALHAHAQPPGDDGRGLLDRAKLSWRMTEFFLRLRSADPLAHVQTFLDALNEEAGLLVARGDDAYAFPHLTFQEYLAACGLAEDEDMVDRAYEYWTGDDASRWREVLLLFVGRLRPRTRDVKVYAVPWLEQLLAQKVGRETKAARQRGWDAALAALSYRELGGQTTLATTQIDVESRIEVPLRTAIINLLSTPDSGVVLADHLVAADLLADLGDPRFPVTIEAWQHTLTHERIEVFGRPAGYWCFVRRGTYRIGGWEEDQETADITLPPFWVARSPVTVAQYAQFIAAGGYNTEQWWTPNGWQWKQQRNRTQPWGWNEAPYNGSNQPVIGVTWYEAMAFTHWLTAQLQDTLPPGYVIRLPSEAEWEAAAAYDAAMHRRTYPWGEDEPTPERAIYQDDQGNRLGRPAPIGSCPAGMAACGALDMTGNVWEWTVSSYHAYPGGSGPADAAEDFLPGNVSDTSTWDTVLRGGSWHGTNVHCGARYWDPPIYVFEYFGFRVFAAPLP